MRKSKRVRSVITPLPHRLQSLFHSVGGDPVVSTKLSRLHADPNVYLVSSFLSEGDIEYFDKICTVYQQKFESSFTEDVMNVRVVSEERTSTFLYLGKGQDQIARAIERRASDLVGLSSLCVEPLQIVSYTNGQKFDVHHDAGTIGEDEDSVELVTPRRLVTMFIYLNDLPEGQGETHFPRLGLRVRPRRGAAVLFCNLLPSGEADLRTIHEACPVSAGLWKYGVNVWMVDGDLQDLSLERSHFKTRQIKFERETSALLRAQALTRAYCDDIARRQALETFQNHTQQQGESVMDNDKDDHGVNGQNEDGDSAKDEEKATHSAIIVETVEAVTATVTATETETTAALAAIAESVTEASS